jgi:hypothetical protein
VIDLVDLRKLLVAEIIKAEAKAIESVRLSLHGAKEDDITTLFIVEAERGLNEATDSRRVAAAVRADLERGYRSGGYSPPRRLQHITDGLVARLRRQQPEDEGRTGADFGLLLVEPRFQLRWGASLDLQRAGLKRGLLVQAKRRLRDGRWNQLTARQQKRLPERMAHAALLRYEFVDGRRRNLRSFAWHILTGLATPAVVQWLASGAFPDALETSAIVAGLSRGDYGTADPGVIERDICPDAGSYVVLEIDWEDGHDPEDVVVRINRDLTEQTLHHEQQVYVRVGR